jgi:hypothetical protein
MELLSREQCVQWCSENDIRAEGHGAPDFEKREGDKRFSLFGKKGEYISVYYPEIYRKCVSISLELSNFFGNFETESLFWMQDWGIGSPEYEELGFTLWEGLRPDSNNKSFQDFPGVLYGPGDSDYVRALFLLSMLNGWDANWIPKGGDSYVDICHDEWLAVAFRSRSAIDTKDFLSRWKIRSARSKYGK